MPARKSKKTTRSSEGQMIPYGPAIRDAMARGDVQEMRKVATSSKKLIKEVQKRFGLVGTQDREPREEELVV